jgi:hypothetical protein
VPDPNNPNLPETEVFGPQVNLTTYGIRDKGGPVIVDASVTNNFVSGAVETLFGGTTEVLTGQAEGLTITANSNGAANPEADISSIGIEGESTSTVGLATNATTGLPVLDANGEQELAQNTPAAATATTTTTTVNTLSLIINGTAAVDVMDVVGFVQTADTPADVTEIENNTPGEITTVSAATIGVLSSHGSIGLAATTSTGTAILPTEVLGLFQTWDPVNNKPVAGAAGPGNVFPWNQQAIGVVTTGDVLIIEAYQGVGNVDVVGDIGAVVANADGKLTPGGFDGIAGPIIADMPTPGVAGRILSVSIGQGILPSGSGEVGFAGLYAQGDIGTVTNNGLPQADIRGNIVSNEAIDNINLTNGSIINDKILSSAPIAAFGDSEDTSFGFTSPGTGSTISSPTNEIRNITINGRGGIIGILIDATDVGPITVGSQGFGIFETGIALTGNGVLGKITAGGYGIRNSTFIVGAVAQGLNATGNGSQLPVTAFGTDVRPSDLGDGFDPYSGLEVNPLNDLNANLGTSAGTPVITGATDTGVLQDDDVRATTSLNSVNAQTIRTGTPLFVPLITPEFNIPVVGQLYAMEFNVAGLIGSVNVRGNIDGLEITTGRLGSFIQRGSVSRLGISVAGTIASLVIHGNLGQTVTDLATNTPEPDSYISATGAEGSIGTLTVYGNLNADITANDTITRLTVGGNVNGSIFAEGQTTGLTLGYLRVGGAIADGSLIVDGNAGTIITNGSLGSPTGALTIEGNLNSLSVGASHGRGAGLELPLHVEGSVGSLTVFGRIDGTVQIDGDLKKLKVTNDGTQSNIINGNMTVNGRLYTANIINGNIAANVIANGFIKSFTISRGSVQSDGSVQSQIDAIQNFRITGGAPYGMFGSLLAASGFNENIDISGNVGDGIDAADITAATGNKFRVRGSIRTNATIAVSGQLNVLQVDHNIETNANVSAHPLKKLIVGGTNTGNVITV